MTTRADATYYEGTPTELIIFSGKTESGREVEMIVPMDMAIKILTEAAAAYKVCGHVGHAIWHAKENRSTDGCSSCKK